MDYIEQIGIGSPWWSNPGWEKYDRYLKAAADSKVALRYLPDYHLLKDGSPKGPAPQECFASSASPPAAGPGLDIIKGPRQIGKTTEIKIIVRDLLSKGAPPKSIAYFTCDVISKHKELFETLKTFSRHLEITGLKRGIIFLDEVSSLGHWEKGAKAFIDLGLGRNVHILATGSSSIELKGGYERMPGRRNGGADFLFLPAGFGKFCSLVNPEKNVPGVPLMEVLRSEKAFEAFKNEISPDAGFYKNRLRDYLGIGGFPRSISDFVRFGKISGETLSINQSVLFSEFERHKKSLSSALQIMNTVARSISTPLSYNSIMKNLGLGSAQTVKEYIETLARSYLGIQAPCLDISRNMPFSRKNKKIYLSDPVLFRVLEDKLKLAPIEEGKMAENMAAMHIGRSFFLKEWAQMGCLENLFYWKSAKGNEVDFVFLPDKRLFGVEVKYQETISGWDEAGVRRGIGRGILITKNVFEYGKIPKIPLWAFLLMK